MMQNLDDLVLFIEHSQVNNSVTVEFHLVSDLIYVLTLTDADHLV